MSNLFLSAVGIQDTFLTSDPEIDFFKYKYNKHVPYARKIERITMSNSINWGANINVEIPKKGHILTKLYIYMKLPQMTKTDGDYLSWVDNIGMGIFDGPITLEIGGVIVDRIYPEFNDMYDELTVYDERRKNQMTLKSDLYNSTEHNAEIESDVYIPLNFFFNKKYNMGLPLLSMPVQNIKISFKLKNFQDCINFNGTSATFYNIISSEMFAEYIDLDENTAKKFQAEKHTFVIDQVKYNGDEIISSGTTDYMSELRFFSPCKELIFAFVSNTNISNNNYFNYSKDDDTSFLKNATLILNGKKYLDNLPESYYRLVFPYQHHTKIPLKYLYTIPFSLIPEENQPSGSLNMSMLNDIILNLNFKNDNPDLYFRLYGIFYNVVTIDNGFLRLEFDY
jgi:hypothetical protein